VRIFFYTNVFIFVSASKLLSNINSLFTSAYVYHWPGFFRGKELYYPPSFDARVILYPTDKNLRDYLAWRQADVHINNLYNTCFWNLILKGKLNPSQVNINKESRIFESMYKVYFKHKEREHLLIKKRLIKMIKSFVTDRNIYISTLLFFT